MAARSTRNKLKHQAHKMIENCDNIQQHLQFSEDLAAGGSRYIDESLPNIVNMVEMMRQVLIKYRSGL